MICKKTIAWLLVALSAGAAGRAGEPDRPWPDAAAPRAGLCIWIHSTNDRSCVDLARSGRWIVHALCGSDQATAAIRSLFADARLYGLGSAEPRARLDLLPYADRLANRLVIDDWPDAARRGLTWAECLRIVSPRGAVVVGGTTLSEVKSRLAPQSHQVEEVARDGDRVRVTAAWPPDLGQWTHDHHRTAGNAVLATDPINPQAQPLWFQWIDGEQDPQGHHGAMGAIVSAEGRLIALANFDVGALIRDGAIWGTAGRQAYVLSCRDAFNGAVQWLRPWNGTNQKKARRALAAVGGRIFTVENGRLTATDARDGGILYAAEAPVAFEERSQLHCDARVAAVHDPQARVLWVFDAASGKALWHSSESVARVAADGGRVFIGSAASDRAEAGDVRAFEASRGTLLWKKSAGDLGEPAGGKVVLHSAAMGLALVSAGPDKTIVLKGDSGEIVHRLPAQGEPLFVGDKIAAGGNPTSFFDLKTGALAGRGGRPHPYSAMGVWACAGGIFTERMFLDTIRDATKAGSRQAAAGRQYPYMGSASTHKTCITGDVVAHGLIYQPQQGCRCGPHKGPRLDDTRGLYALSPVTIAPPQRAFEEPGPLEEGPAFGKVDLRAAAAGDWPTYRANPERSCASGGALPAPVQALWRAPLAARPAGWIVRSSWRAQHNHNQTISAPVVAGGLVFVALVDEHQVVALDARGGEVRWRFTANARVDSPPTIHLGLCLFGCRDGWVYALRADDGRLAWRRRIAPVDQRILVYGQLECRWPAIGSILVDGRRAYATAGHDRGLGVMVWEFDPATGATLAYRAAPRPTCRNVILVRGEVGGIYLNQTCVTPAPGAGPPPDAPKSAAPRRPWTAGFPDHLHPIDTPIFSASGTASLSPRGGLRLRQIQADRWAWRTGCQVGFADHGYAAKAQSPHAGWDYGAIPSAAVFCVDPAKLAGAAGEALRWQAPAQDVWAMAMAGEALVVAGPRIDRSNAAGPAGPSGERNGNPLPLGKPAEQLWDPSVLSQLKAAWSIRGPDPLAAPGFVKVFNAADGKLICELGLPASAVQDGLAVSGGSVFVTTTEGSVVCLGK